MAVIMIADDSATDRHRLVGALSPLGHDLVETCDGQETEEMLANQPPDILILDVVMPKKDGFEICRKLKSKQGPQNTYVIMISGKDSESDRYWGLKQGADEYLCKPLNMDTLIKVIKEHLT